MYIKFAFDNQISKATKKCIQECGYEVVYHASDEPDDIWVDRALNSGATIFVSPDLDIPNYLDRIRSDAIWIDLPRSTHSGLQSNYILTQLFRVLKNKITSQPVYKLIKMGRYEYLVPPESIDAFLKSKNNNERLQNCYYRILNNSISRGSLE